MELKCRGQDEGGGKGEGVVCETKVMMEEKCEQAVLKFMTYGYSRSWFQPTQPQGLVGRVEWKPIDCLHPYR